jgi:L,D-transpeptidase-like protein/putative peptidoglycan binding protein
MRWRPLLAMSALLPAAALATPAVASAQEGATTAQGQPPATTPVGGRMSISVASGLPTRRLRYVARGQRVVVVGAVRPFVPGQVTTLAIVRRGRVTARHQAPIQAARAGRGRFVVRFVARRRGLMRLVAKHDQTGQQAAFAAGAKRVKAVVWRAGTGASGTRVLLLQRALRSLGFAVPVSRRYGGDTSRAVTAFRRTNGIGRSGYAGPEVYGRLLRRRGAFRLRHPNAGRHVEFDWSRQLLVLANRGRAVAVYHASSGKASTPTVLGGFRFYRKHPGTNSHGMVHSNYFVGGYAIHGYASVPNYPASHGCIRVPIPNARHIYRAISLGERIFLYR